MTGQSGRYATPEGFSVFNGIRSLPDGWGRHLFDRVAGSFALTEFDYLAGAWTTGWAPSPSARIINPLGGLCPGTSRSFRWGAGTWSYLDLASLLACITELEKPTWVPEAYRRFSDRGSSLGGARPKAVTCLDGRQWIAKFSRAEDRYPVCPVPSMRR